jgi:DNA-binding transcriptional MerR regulator
MTTSDDFPVFDDGKDPGAMRTIGEVSRALDIRQHVLRYWEEQFPMLNPVKRSGGRRYYRPEDVRLVVTIDRLVHKEGYTLRGARSAIENGKAERRVAPTIPVETAESLRAELEAIRARLAAALDKS